MLLARQPATTRPVFSTPPAGLTSQPGDGQADSFSGQSPGPLPDPTPPHSHTHTYIYKHTTRHSPPSQQNDGKGILSLIQSPFPIPPQVDTFMKTMCACLCKCVCVYSVCMCVFSPFKDGKCGCRLLCLESAGENVRVGGCVKSEGCCCSLSYFFLNIYLCNLFDSRKCCNHAGGVTAANIPSIKCERNIKY